MMKFETKYRILLWKSYFDKGFAVTNYFKYFVLFFALSTMDAILAIFLTILYAGFCLVFGWAYFKYNWIIAEIEITNKYNLFVKEVRKKLKGGNFKNGKK
ncbi:hypothetical protein M0R04_15690 [Candidatus Dojkabacteria bacterium]|jgi:hypothetical protein|nr:hypothetical protein [Candidatus Dojkabacteria bacterium]